jgi:hypothetical protein
MAPQKILRLYRNAAILPITLVFLFFITISRYLEAPIAYSIIIMSLGFIVGVLVQQRSERKKLRIIEQKGVYESSVGLSLRKGIVLIFLVLIVGSALIALYMYLWLVAPFWLFTGTFIISFMPAIYITSAVIYWHWQRKNKRILYTAENKIYPYPYINNTENTQP